MKKAQLVLVFCLLSFVAFSQAVALVNNSPVAAKEFMWVYKKNNNGTATASFEELQRYLDLYINFKLKVLDAKSLKLDKDTAYLNEIKTYEQLIKAKMRTKSKEDLQYILNEYRDGVLMFNISEKKVWFPNTLASAGALTEEEQKGLEMKWVQQLRDKYPVKIYEEELRKLSKP